MITHLNNLLRHLLLSQIDELTAEAQVRFQPPDDDWRTFVGNLPQTALNLYLVDLRENRKLRSNARVRSTENGQVSEQPAPMRLDCHYLITAWSPAQATDALEPTMDEHALLYEVIAVLNHNAPLNPSRIYPAGSAALDAVDPLIREADLPTEILPVEGFPKLAEFWGTMGSNHRWKAPVYMVVTVPVAQHTRIAGPMVTTRITEYRHAGQAETAETWIQIGGRVLDATNLDPETDEPTPVPGAWVRLETPAGEPLQTTETNGTGQFTFSGLQAGNYQLNWRAEGFPLPANPEPIEVPSPTGGYDLSFE
jgi:hypothetical protein